MKDFYRIMGLQPAATLAEIRGAYRRQASALHPDRNPSEKAHLAFQELQEAYEVLSNPANLAIMPDEPPFSPSDRMDAVISRISTPPA